MGGGGRGGARRGRRRGRGGNRADLDLGWRWDWEGEECCSRARSWLVAVVVVGGRWREQQVVRASSIGLPSYAPPHQYLRYYPNGYRPRRSRCKPCSCTSKLRRCHCSKRRISASPLTTTSHLPYKGRANPVLRAPLDRTAVRCSVHGTSRNILEPHHQDQAFKFTPTHKVRSSSFFPRPSLSFLSP